MTNSEMISTLNARMSALQYDVRLTQLAIEALQALEAPATKPMGNNLPAYPLLIHRAGDGLRELLVRLLKKRKGAWTITDLTTGALAAGYATRTAPEKFNHNVSATVNSAPLLFVRQPGNKVTLR